MNGKQENKKRGTDISNRTQELDAISIAIAQAYRTFNSTLDTQLMDACIFEINALRTRRNALLKEMRQQSGASGVS